jgi:hypothetical protein
MPTFGIVDLERLSCPLMLLEDLAEAEAIADELRRRHRRRIAVRRFPSSAPVDLPEVTATASEASWPSAS